jgi:hypothetical protein
VPTLVTDLAAQADAAAQQPTDPVRFNPNRIANLLILAGKANDAESKFREVAEKETNPIWVRDAREGIARALRAEDGSVGRANAYILSLKNAPGH